MNKAVTKDLFAASLGSNSNNPLDDAHLLQREVKPPLPVFPLPLFILPGGVQRLRIFEPRYLTMVSEASRNGGFIIARYDKSLQLNVPDWGAKVDIIDFHRDEDNLLVIDVKASHLVTLEKPWKREDNLLMAQAELRQHWSDQSSAEETSELGKALGELFARHPQLAGLYPEPAFGQIEWVCARFLEILPLSLHEKERFIVPDSFEQLKSFLHTLILGDDKIC